jgi:hypothetical protein
MKLPMFQIKDSLNNELEGLKLTHDTIINEYKDSEKEYKESWKPFINLIGKIRKVYAWYYKDIFGYGYRYSDGYPLYYKGHEKTSVRDFLTFDDYGFDTNFIDDIYFYTFHRRFLKKPKRNLLLHIILPLPFDEITDISIKGEKEYTYVYETFYNMLTEYYKNILQESINKTEEQSSILSLNKLDLEAVSAI